MSPRKNKDQRPLVYGVAAAVIVAMALFLFWPRGGQDEDLPEMVLTPHATQQASVETTGTPEPDDGMATTNGGADDEAAAAAVQSGEVKQDPPPTKVAPKDPDTPPRQPAGSTEVEKPAKTTSTPSGVPSPGNSGQHLLYVGSFGNQSNAQARANELKARGIPASVAPSRSADGGELWRVRVGYFSDLQQARAYANWLEETHQLDSWLATR